jgi:hypothetical protein
MEAGDGERVTLALNQIACRSWLKQDHPHIVSIKWFDVNTVILYYDGIAAIVSRESWNNIRLYAVYKLFVSNSYLFVSHDEESLYSFRPGELESNIISVFLRDGRDGRAQSEWGRHPILAERRSA